MAVPRRDDDATGADIQTVLGNVGRASASGFDLSGKHRDERGWQVLSDQDRQVERRGQPPQHQAKRVDAAG